MVTSGVDKDGHVTNENMNGVSISSMTGTTGNKKTLDVDDFLKLLVTQMQYQDPLEPSDNTQYIAQMATFSQVEATAQMQNSVERQMASSLVGQTVMVNTDKNSDGYVMGTVNYWQSIDGKIYLGIGKSLYDLKDLNTVIDKDFFKQYEDSLEKDKEEDKNKVDEKDKDKVENKDGSKTGTTDKDKSGTADKSGTTDKETTDKSKIATK